MRDGQIIDKDQDAKIAEWDRMCSSHYDADDEYDLHWNIRARN